MSLELVNSSTQSVTSGSKLNLGNVNIRRCDGSVVYNGTDSLTFQKNGIYMVMSKVDATATETAQTLKYALAYNGTVSTIASASAVVADIGDTVTLVVPKMIKICNAPLVLTLVNSGTDLTTYENLIIDIWKE
jgi:hypothetical protein